jgi:hypothetical protein
VHGKAARGHALCVRADASHAYTVSATKGWVGVMGTGLEAHALRASATTAAVRAVDGLLSV